MNIPMMKESRSGKVSGEFEDRGSAENAKSILLGKAGVDDDDIRIIAPDDPAFSPKVEPESRGIALTMLNAHYVLGVAGLLFGLTVSALLVLFGPPLAASSPVMTFIAITTISTFLSLLWAGFIALRPDHDPLTMRAEHAKRAGRWTLVVHTHDETDTVQARKILESIATHNRHTLT